MKNSILSNKFTYLGGFIVIFAMLALLFGMIIHKNTQLQQTKEALNRHKRLFKIAADMKQTRIEHITNVTKKLLILQPKLAKGNLAEWYAEIITTYCGADIENIFIAILFGESSFDHTKVNKSGDYGIGQINYKIWGNFFEVTQKELLNPIINIQIAFTILQMAQISHGTKNDWYGYYHSWNHISRKKYVKKIDRILKLINGVEEDGE